MRSSYLSLLFCCGYAVNAQNGPACQSGQGQQYVPEDTGNRGQWGPGPQGQMGPGPQGQMGPGPQGPMGPGFQGQMGHGFQGQMGSQGQWIYQGGWGQQGPNGQWNSGYRNNYVDRNGCYCQCSGGGSDGGSDGGNTGGGNWGQGTGGQVDHRNGQPCLGSEITRDDWFVVSPRKAGTLENSDLAEKEFNLPENSLLFVGDHSYRCEQFEVSVNGRVIGRTYGEKELDNSGECGGAEATTCAKNHGYWHGYFRIPAGKNKIGLRMINVTEKCKGWGYGVAQLRFHKQCANQGGFGGFRNGPNAEGAYGSGEYQDGQNRVYNVWSAQNSDGNQPAGSPSPGGDYAGAQFPGGQ